MTTTWDEVRERVLREVVPALRTAIADLRLELLSSGDRRWAIVDRICTRAGNLIDVAQGTVNLTRERVLREDVPALRTAIAELRAEILSLGAPEARRLSEVVDRIGARAANLVDVVQAEPNQWEGPN